MVPSKSTAGSSNSKSKKSSKDREKRKSQPGVDITNPHGSDKGSPSKESGARQYAGISPDSICIYAEQSNFEHLSLEVQNGLAEDINYKLRFIIHDALVKARLSGRNTVTSSDIDATFETLNIDKVYGACSNPNWVTFGDQGLSYLDDQKINLVEIAEQESSFVQPGDVVVTRKWLPETKEVSKPLKNYFVTMCDAVVGNNATLRKLALQDISCNTRIGPIVEWFYNFGYCLLSKDITYDCLTLYALELIEALERNDVALITVSEKILKLLVRLILQRLLKSVTTLEVLKPMCYVLAVLCIRIPLRELVMYKMLHKMPEIKSHFPLPIINVINSLGIDAIEQIFLPYMGYFLSRVSEGNDLELTFSILSTYNIICKEFCDNREIHEAFHATFNETHNKLIIYWRHVKRKKPTNSSEQEMNWFNTKKMLRKTRRRLDFKTEIKKYELDHVFPDRIVKNFTVPVDDRFQFRFQSFTPLKVRTKPAIDQKIENNQPAKLKELLIVGKTSLLIPIWKNLRYPCKNFTFCYDHSLISYNF